MQLDELVRTALTERRGLLEQIVRREVEAVVSELVDAQLNGNTSTEMVLSRAALPQEATEQTGQGSGSTQTLADRKRLVSAAARTFASTPAGAPVEPAAAGSSANVKLAPPGRHQTAARSLTRRRHRSEDAEASVASSPTASGPSAAAR